MKTISEDSVKLIKEHLSELDLTFPLDDEDACYKILKYFESMDGGICYDLSTSNDEKDRKLLDDVDRIISEFQTLEDPVDYQDLERRLKS